MGLCGLCGIDQQRLIWDRPAVRESWNMVIVDPKKWGIEGEFIQSSDGGPRLVIDKPGLISIVFDDSCVCESLLKEMPAPWVKFGCWMLQGNLVSVMYGVAGIRVQYLGSLAKLKIYSEG